MLYTKDYIITALSNSLGEYGTSFSDGGSAAPLLRRAPIIPTGRVRQIDRGNTPYTVTNGTSVKFPLGYINYSGSWVPGKIGNYALKFDGAAGHILIGSTSDFAWMHGKGNTSTFKWSVSFWMKYNTAPSGINALEVIFSTNDVTDGAGVTIAYDDRGSGGATTLSIFLAIYNAATGGAIITLEQAGDYPDDTNWHHIVVTYDHSLSSYNGKIYVDGVVKAQGADTGNTAADAVSKRVLTIGETGGGAGGSNYEGSLDELAVWNVALTQTEVSQLYKRNVGEFAYNIQASNLVSYWNFEELVDGGGPGSSIVINYPNAISSSLAGTMTSMPIGGGGDFPIPKKTTW